MTGLRALFTTLHCTAQTTAADTQGKTPEGENVQHAHLASTAQTTLGQALRLSKTFSAVLQELNICQAGEKTPDVCNSNNERRFVMIGPGMCSRRSEIGTEWCHRRFLPHLEWNNAGALQNGWTVNRPLLGWKEPSSKGFSRGRVLESSLTMVCSQASKDRASGNFSKNLETITWLLPYHLLLSLTMEHGAWCSEQRPLRISNFSEITVALRSLSHIQIHTPAHMQACTGMAMESAAQISLFLHIPWPTLIWVPPGSDHSTTEAAFISAPHKGLSRNPQCPPQGCSVWAATASSVPPFAPHRLCLSEQSVYELLRGCPQKIGDKSSYLC